MKRVSWEKMHADLDMILMSTFIQELVLIFVGRRLASLKVLKENLANQDLNHHSQLIVEYLIAQQLSLMSKQSLFAQQS